MPMINCYVDDELFRWLQIASQQTRRRVEELAEAAIENAAIEFKVSQPKPPGYSQYTGYRP